MYMLCICRHLFSIHSVYLCLYSAPTAPFNLASSASWIISDRGATLVCGPTSVGCFHTDGSNLIIQLIRTGMTHELLVAVEPADTIRGGWSVTNPEQDPPSAKTTKDTFKGFQGLKFLR